MNELVKYIVFIGPANSCYIAEHTGNGVYQYVASVRNEDLAREMAGSMNDRIELRKAGP